MENLHFYGKLTLNMTKLITLLALMLAGNMYAAGDLHFGSSDAFVVPIDGANHYASFTNSTGRIIYVKHLLIFANPADEEIAATINVTRSRLDLPFERVWDFAWTGQPATRDFAPDYMLLSPWDIINIQVNARPIQGVQPAIKFEAEVLYTFEP
jgi:hypothetical protein